MRSDDEELMTPTPFPGQENSTDLNLAQLDALSSVACADVYASLSFYEPFAIREIAREVGKSPAAVGAHVAKLVEVNLVIHVGTRKRRSRIEALYVLRARSANFQFLDQPWVYVEKYLDRFRGAMRLAERQHEMFQRAIREEPEFIPFGSYNWNTAWLTKAQRITFGERLRALRMEIVEASETDPLVRENGEFVRLHLSTLFFPTVAESKRRIWKKSK